MKTKTLPTLFLCIAGAGAGTGIGWLLRDKAHTAGAPGGALTKEETVSGKTGSQGSSAVPAGAPAEITASRLAQQQGAMRWLYLLGAAETATAAEMPALVRAAAEYPGALRMLAARWAELDPQHMYDTLRLDYARLRGAKGDLSSESSLVQYLFEDWAKKDPEAAIAALHDQSVLPGVRGRRHSLLNNMMKTDVARGLKLIKEWNVTDFIPDMKGVEKWAAQDPRAAAGTIFECASGYITRYLVDELAKSWAASDPAGALVFAGGQRGPGGIQLAQSVIIEWAQRDLKAALAHVGAQTDALARSRLGLPLVETWAKSDPQAALLWANDNLKGEARVAAAGSIVKSMAATDRAAAAEFIAGLEAGGAKDRAVVQLMETWVGDKWGNNAGDKSEATAALTWMAALPDAETRRRAMEQIAWRLAHYAPEETMAFINGPQGTSASPAIVEQAARHLARKNPETAMQWVEKLPAAQRTGAQDSVLSEWISSRPAGAQQWALKLPAGDDRRRSITAVTTQLLWQSPPLAQQWVESLPAADRPAAAAALATNGSSLTKETRAALEALVK